MPVTIKDIAAAQREFVRKLETELSRFPTLEQPAPPDLLLQELKTLIEEQKRRLAAAEQAKAQAIARLDAEIEQRKATIARLEKQLAEQEALINGGKPVPGKPRANGPRSETQRQPSPRPGRGARSRAEKR